MIESVLGESEQFITEFTSALISRLGQIQLDMLCETVPNFSFLLPIQKRTNPVAYQDREDILQMFAQAGMFKKKQMKYLNHFKMSKNNTKYDM